MSNQIVISSGAKVRNLDGVLTGTSGIVNSLGINVPDGIPQLDGSGKILVSQLPNSVMEYKGTWNAATNTPTLANGTGNAGDVYLCSVAGTVNFGAGPITFAVGDQVLYSGTTWERASGATGTVTSVSVTESGDALTITGSPITTSGTINIGFAGTGAQYVKGDGTLATFPTTIDQAKRLITEVYNSTGSTLTKGTVVYINGGQGNLPTITKAIATGDSTSAQTYGVVQSDITNNNNGFVVVLGSLTDIDTQAYSVGTQLYLSGSTAGAWTSTKPSAPIHLVYVGIVVRSHPTQGVVEIRIQNGYELEELHDVAITSVANNDGIFYNSSNDLWENKTIDEVLGYTPANDSLVVKLAGTQTITGSKTFSTNTTFNQGLSISSGYALSWSSNLYVDGSDNTLRFATSGLYRLQINDSGIFRLNAYTTNGLLKTTNADGTFAIATAGTDYVLPSALSSYVPYTGATTFVNLGTQLFYSGGVAVENAGNGLISTDGSLSAGKGIFLTNTVSGGQWSSGTTNLVARNSGFLITRSAGGGLLIFDSAVTYDYTFPSSNGTIALTSNLSSYLPLSGGTLTGALSGTSASFSSSVTASQGIFPNASTPANTTYIGQSNTGAYLGTAASGKPMYFETEGTERVRISSDGNLGLGTSTPSRDPSGTRSLAISGASVGYAASLDLYATRNYAIYTGGAGSLGFYDLTAGAERMTITSGGNVGINTSSPNALLEVAGTSANTDFRVSRSVSSSTYFYIKAPGGSPSTATMGVNGTDVMVLNSSGNVGVGNTGYSNIRFAARGADTSSSNYSLWAEDSNGTTILAARNDLQIYAGNIGTGTGTTLILTSGGLIQKQSSSIRYKKDVQPIDIGLNFILSLNPVSYLLKDGDVPQVGFIAEDFPEDRLVSMSMIDNKDESKGYQRESVNYAQIVAPLVKAIQELNEKIKQLENK